MKVGPDCRTPPNKCSNCGYLLDACFGLGHDSQPGPGSVSICGRCGKITLFDENLELRDPTEAERTEILSLPSVQAARRAVLIIHRGDPS